MLVSKNALPGIRVGPVENESWRQWPPQFAQASERPLPALIAVHFEDPAIGNSNLDLVTLFQFERFNHRCGQAYGQAISPLRNLHRPPLIYILYCISIKTVTQVMSRIRVTSVISPHSYDPNFYV